jgi:hypothetical protein
MYKEVYKMTGGLMDLIHVHQFVVRKNEAEEEFTSVEVLRDHQRQHLGYPTSKDSFQPVLLSAVVSRKNLLAGDFMQAKIVGRVLNRADFMADPEKKCPRFNDLKAGALADSSKPYKGMLAELQRAREQARNLKKRHSQIDEDVNGVTHMVSDIQCNGRRNFVVASTDTHYGGNGGFNY